MDKPIILFSSYQNLAQPGDDRFNGGFKCQAVWCKLLRQHGYEAYRVTMDGTQLEWLIEHPPAISFDTMRQWKTNGRNLRIVTTWLEAVPVIDVAMQGDTPCYFYDCELAYSRCGSHFEMLRSRLHSFRLATNNRTHQGWYMREFNLTPTFIPEWSDTDYWKPAPEKRVKHRIGYMWEGDHTEHTVEFIKAICHAAGYTDVEMRQIGGSEQEVLTGMQHCDLFLGLNPGKDELYGEGCPRAPEESQHVGCVVIAGDVHGNREYILDGYTGFIVARNNPMEMAERVIYLLSHPDECEQMRATGIDFAQRYFAPTERRWKTIQEWLQL